MDTILSLILVLIIVYFIIRTIVLHIDSNYNYTYVKYHDSWIWFPITKYKKLVIPPCYKCKHSAKQDRYSIKESLCTRKKAVDFYERLYNEHYEIGVDNDEVRGSKLCNFKPKPKVENENGN